MWQFAAGFVLALAVVTPAALVFYKKLARIRQRHQKYLNEIEELGKLTGELAHEIKNPLSTIKVNLQLISEDIKDSNFGTAGQVGDQRLPRASRKIAIVQKEAERLEQILDGFLRYASRTELQPANVNINDIVSDMIDFYSPQCRSHSITIRHRLYAEPLICKADANMLKQVILNLFINAQQAMNRDGELMIRTARQSAGRLTAKDYAQIQISDTGSGIAAEKLPHIFEAYHSSRPQGCGLGLATAKRIIEAHNGTITVASETGKGTAFTIQLPLAEAGKRS
ncbi:MAG: ATP-binding protein [Planctomycetota bacterium]|nr:ATP-binding protein [Planctomycetota bacterium]